MSTSRQKIIDNLTRDIKEGEEKLRVNQRVLDSLTNLEQADVNKELPGKSVFLLCMPHHQRYVGPFSTRKKAYQMLCSIEGPRPCLHDYRSNIQERQIDGDLK